MKTEQQTDTVSFTTKGQIVIPAHLRREFKIEAGTKAIVQATPEGILLRPMTEHAIDKLFGILKRRPGQKSLDVEWAEHKREEARLGERKLGRHRSR